MNKGDYEQIRTRLTRNYQLAKRTLLRTEKKNINTPIPDYQEQIAELRGYMRGLKKCMEFMEDRVSDVDLFGGAA